MYFLVKIIFPYSCHIYIYIYIYIFYYDNNMSLLLATWFIFYRIKSNVN